MMVCYSVQVHCSSGIKKHLLSICNPILHHKLLLTFDRSAVLDKILKKFT